MRLLLVPDPTAPHGVDAFCRALAERASARGHQARVQSVLPGPLAFEDADVVIINSLQPAALSAARAAGKKTALRLIDAYCGAAPEVLAEAQRLALRADLLLVPSLYLEKILRGWGANGSLQRIPYAYDQIMAQQIALVTIRASRPVGFQVVAGGTFNSATQAGFESLLSAVARMRLDCHLSLWGDGPARPALKNRAEQLIANDKVTFLGEIPHVKILEYLRAAKLYVDPCGLDGFPTLALHAFSEGCPVLGARAGALEELIQDGENGMLFPPGSSLALSEAIVTLSSVSGLSLKLIAGGIKTVEKHSWNATADSVFAALDSLPMKLSRAG